MGDGLIAYDHDRAQTNSLKQKRREGCPSRRMRSAVMPDQRQPR
jgi:hypothetical protein